jgi:D-aminoacyl-tRNA deacylase
MRIVLQRVREARVEVAGEIVGRIGPGLLVLIAVAQGDSNADADYMAAKTLGLRIFSDAEGKMNRSVQEVGGDILVVSQFTLYGDTRRGRRPSFDRSAPPERAREIYEYFTSRLRESGLVVATGLFQEFMQVYLVNEGPVTLVYDSGKNVVEFS